MLSAAEITAQAKSNLAFTFIGVAKERRPDLIVFYAYCRIIDDIADASDLSKEEKQTFFDEWNAVLHGQAEPEPDHELQRELRSIQQRHDIDADVLTEVIRGCESDLQPQRFGTWEDLQVYCDQVASSVGLSSLPLFGATEKSEPYAIALGRALQLTNIIRDVGEDLRNDGRIYLPLSDLHRFQYTERDLVGQVHDGRFLALMTFEAERAESLFREAETLIPPAERDALFAPIVMGRLYHQLLQDIKSDQFRVFDRRYKLSKPRKFGILAREYLRQKVRKS